MESKIHFLRIIFWILWVLLLVLIPLYLFTFSFEISAVKLEKIGSILSPIIGGLVLIAQFLVIIRSFKQARGNLPISEAFLTLLGGSILIGFFWQGGCAIMGPYRIAG
jgi:hypothetical protein